MTDRMVGAGKFRYRALARWGEWPPGYDPIEVAGVAVDSRDRVYVFNRGARPVVVFEADGRLVDAWGEGCFRRPHGITIAGDDTLWLTDDLGHSVGQYTAAGQLRRTLTDGTPSDTGVVGLDYRTIRQGAGPFNVPTNVAFAADGSLYVSDGYGNARVHHFGADGRLLRSWGEPGSGPGQFNVPHGIAVDRQGRVLVADRENSRIQIFSGTGQFLDEWTDVARPMQLCITVDERVVVVDVGWWAGLWPWQSPAADARRSACLSVFDRDGNRLARWGEGEAPESVGAFFAPHDVCVDSTGAIYVGEVVRSAGGNRGLVAADCHCLQKFVPV